MGDKMWIFLADKDHLTVIVSVVAAIIALGSAWFTYRQKASESTSTLRSQLIDTISKLVEFEGRALDLTDRIRREKNDIENHNLRSQRNVISEQRRALAELAVFIFEKLKQADIADVEYAAVARAFAAASEPGQASYYWLRAIDVSNQITYRTKLLGMYGDFLFHFDPEEGRTQYSSAEHAFDKNANPRVQDLIRWEKVHILSRWAVREVRIKSREDFDAKFKRAEDIFKRAENVCRAIKDESLQREAEESILMPRRREIDEIRASMEASG